MTGSINGVNPVQFAVGIILLAAFLFGVLYSIIEHLKGK